MGMRVGMCVGLIFQGRHKGCRAVKVKEFNGKCNNSEISEHRERIKKIWMGGGKVVQYIWI